MNVILCDAQSTRLKSHQSQDKFVCTVGFLRMLHKTSLYPVTVQTKRRKGFDKDVRRNFLYYLEMSVLLPVSLEMSVFLSKDVCTTVASALNKSKSEKNEKSKTLKLLET